MKAKPAVAGLGEQQAQCAGPPFRPPQLALAQQNAAIVAEAHAHRGGGKARQPAPADASGEQQEKSARGADGAVGDERRRVPHEARGGGDSVKAGEVADRDSEEECEGEERGVPAAPSAQAWLLVEACGMGGSISR